MTSICKICGMTANEVEFYKGVNCRCKECHKRMVRENRAEKFDQYQLYEKMRYKRDPHRAERNKAYFATEAGKRSHAISVKRRALLHPEKRAANILVGNAVRDNRLIKPAECSRCGTIPPRRHLHAHHHDYYKPLDVEWICIKCHALEHHGVAPPPPAKSRIRGRHVARGNS